MVVFSLAVQEAVATGDPELVSQVLERRDFQRHSSRVGGVPELLRKLKEVCLKMYSMLTFLFGCSILL